MPSSPYSSSPYGSSPFRTTPPSTFASSPLMAGGPPGGDPGGGKGGGGLLNNPVLLAIAAQVVGGGLSAYLQSRSQDKATKEAGRVSDAELKLKERELANSEQSTKFNQDRLRTGAPISAALIKELAKRYNAPGVAATVPDYAQVAAASSASAPAAPPAMTTTPPAPSSAAPPDPASANRQITPIGTQRPSPYMDDDLEQRVRAIFG